MRKNLGLFLSSPLITSCSPLAAFKRYVIVRDIPDIHEKNLQELGGISAASCTALSKAGLGRVQVSDDGPVMALIIFFSANPYALILYSSFSYLQWQHSYVADGKTFCVHLAVDEDAIREHATIGG